MLLRASLAAYADLRRQLDSLGKAFAFATWPVEGCSSLEHFETASAGR